MKCSVVILNWNGEKMLRQFLPSVLCHTQIPDVEIVVADNGSTDGSLEYLQTQPVRIVILDKNYGFAEGYNRALEYIDAHYTVLLNSDVEVTPNWLDNMLTYMDNHPNIIAAQPKVLSWYSKELWAKGEVSAIRFEHAGAAGGMIDMLGYPYCRGRIMTHVEEDHGQYDCNSHIFWATGACMIIRTQIYKGMGGLDANFFAHQEEIDLCWRILNQYPYSIMALPSSVVYHVGGGTLGYESPRKTFLNFRNNLLMLRKNLPSSQLWWVMWIRFFMDYAAALQMLITKQWKNALAVVEARIAYHKLKKHYPKSHSQSSKSDSLIAQRSIIWDFYIRKKKK